jgi:hypothetical protein
MNWKQILFSLSEPIAYVGIYIAYNHANKVLEDPSLFTLSNLSVSFFLTLAFIDRMPYMWNRPLARFFLILNAIGWAYVTYIYVKAYDKYKLENTCKK